MKFQKKTIIRTDAFGLRETVDNLSVLHSTAGVVNYRMLYDGEGMNSLIFLVSGSLGCNAPRNHR